MKASARHCHSPGPLENPVQKVPVSRLHPTGRVQDLALDPVADPGPSVLVLDTLQLPAEPHPFLSRASTSSTLMPKMKRFSSPASSAISTLAPSMVPMVRAPLSMNFMFPVPEASVPAVEICSDRSEAGMTGGQWFRSQFHLHSPQLSLSLMSMAHRR